MNNQTKMLLILLIAAAMSYCTKADADIAIGAKTTDSPGLLIHDFNANSLMHPDMFGLERYGFGRGQLEISERPQMLAENRGGVLLGSGWARMGIEPGAGMIAYRNRPAYQYDPALSAGVKLDLGVVGLYAAPRAGLSYNNNRNDILTGGVIAAQVLFINATYWRNDYYNSKGSLDIYDITIGNKYNLQKQVATGKDDLYYVGMRVETW